MLEKNSFQNYFDWYLTILKTVEVGTKVKRISQATVFMDKNGFYKQIKKHIDNRFQHCRISHNL